MQINIIAQMFLEGWGIDIKGPPFKLKTNPGKITLLSACSKVNADNVDLALVIFDEAGDD